MCKAPGYHKSDDVPLDRLAMDDSLSHCPGAPFAGTLVLNLAWWMLFNTAVYLWLYGRMNRNVPLRSQKTVYVLTPSPVSPSFLNSHLGLGASSLPLKTVTDSGDLWHSYRSTPPMIRASFSANASGSILQVAISSWPIPDAGQPRLLMANLLTDTGMSLSVPRLSVPKRHLSKTRLWMNTRRSLQGCWRPRC